MSTLKFVFNNQLKNNNFLFFFKTSITLIEIAFKHFFNWKNNYISKECFIFKNYVYIAGKTDDKGDTQRF